jgi:hypothetical protein
LPSCPVTCCFKKNFFYTSIYIQDHSVFCLVLNKLIRAQFISKRTTLLLYFIIVLRTEE